jgi:hypothetical protein
MTRWLRWTGAGFAGVDFTLSDFVGDDPLVPPVHRRAAQGRQPWRRWSISGATWGSTSVTTLVLRRFSIAPMMVTAALNFNELAGPPA